MIVEEIQTLLKNKGFDPGRIDGVMGPNTERALKDYGMHMLASPTLWPENNDPVDPFDDETKTLVNELERDEGVVLHAYKDSLGYLTIGIGRLIDERKGGGITQDEAHYLKMNDVKKVRQDLDRELPWWRTLDPVRRRALQNMCFQLGIGGLKKFTSSLAHIQSGDYARAGQNLRKSLWYRQTTNRAERVIKMFETGKAQ